jgi:hypothetical protein
MRRTHEADEEDVWFLLLGDRRSNRCKRCQTDGKDRCQSGQYALRIAFRCIAWFSA